MNLRETFFNAVQKKNSAKAPFFPDISTWFENTRKEFGKEEIFPPGAFIPDGHWINKNPSRLSGKMATFTYVDFYKEYGWGLPAHIYDWLETKYDGQVTVSEKREGKTKRITWETKAGTLTRNYVLDHDGSWAPADYLLKDWEKDVPALKLLLEHTGYSADFSKAEKFLNETPGFGVCDTVVWRSPFGRLVHEYLGFENVIYTIMDYEDEVEDLLEFIAQDFFKILELAAQNPPKIVIVSDHADENLISPPYYEKYCIPLYRRAADFLHSKGKIVSTHLDGNIKGFMKILGKTGFDLLDGCTPAPMFNYTPEELAAAPDCPSCYLGIPASLFVGKESAEEVGAFGRRIAKAFDNQVIVNVGDILPPNGSIEKVIAAGVALAE